MHKEQITGRVFAVVFAGSLLAGPAVAQQNSDSGTTAGDTGGGTPVTLIRHTASPEPYARQLEDIRTVEGIRTDALDLSEDEWQAFGERLEAALASDHKGLQHGALRLIIAYGPHVELSQEAVFNAMRIYRNGETERARRMAVVALAEMNSHWAIEFLGRSVRFEKSPLVRSTMLAVLYEASEPVMAL